MTSLLFYMFSSVLLASGIATVTVRQPVTAVLCMILAFFNAAGLLLFLGAEFLAFILLIVYVGAVAVLFLFVVMMLDVKGGPPRENLRKKLPLGIGIGTIMFIQMMVVAAGWPEPAMIPVNEMAEGVDNTRSLGQVLYTDYAYLFQIAGLVLLTSMIGAILLTLRDRKDTKRQNHIGQLDRQRDEVIEIKKVKSGEGVL